MHAKKKLHWVLLSHYIIQKTSMIEDCWGDGYETLLIPVTLDPDGINHDTDPHKHFPLQAILAHSSSVYQQKTHPMITPTAHFTHILSS